MWKTAEGSSGRLIQLCVAYFVFYVITGVAIKYYLDKPELGFPGMNGMEFQTYSTISSVTFVSMIVLILRWYKMESVRMIQWGSLKFPYEFLYIVPSGVCTAVVIPTTTLMYTLPISIMVAMVIMRAAVILIGRVVDTIQIAQGVLKKRVYAQENIAVIFALAAVSLNVFWSRGPGHFDFLQSPEAMGILGSYIVAYSIRIYIMNYYKNTRDNRARQNNKAFFGVEQLVAATTIVIAGIVFFYSPEIFNWEPIQIEQLRGAVLQPHPFWPSAMLWSLFYGGVAFVSVFIFMFHGRTATFACLVNRLTSLVAGTASTVVYFYFFGGKFPNAADWTSLACIFIAVGFLTAAEKKRTDELMAMQKVTSPT